MTKNNNIDRILQIKQTVRFDTAKTSTINSTHLMQSCVVAGRGSSFSIVLYGSPQNNVGIEPAFMRNGIDYTYIKHQE